MFKKMICLMMLLAMSLSLVACGGEAAPVETQAQTVPATTEAPTLPPLDLSAYDLTDAQKQEIQRAYELGFPVDKLDQQTISGKELAVLLDTFLELTAPENVAQWKEQYPDLRSDDGAMTRFNAMAVIFLATRLAGDGYINVNFLPGKAQTLTHSWDEDYLNWGLYGGFDALPMYDVGAWEPVYLDGAAYNYFLGRMSFVSNAYPFDIDEESNSLRVKDNCTYAEALVAIVRTLDSEWAASDVKFEATEVQSREARYVPIEEVGTYNKDIVPDELIANVDLPEAGNGKAPVWNGYILETKGILNQTYQSDSWKKYTPGLQYFNKFEVDRVAELEFNCIRVMYGLSFFSNPDDIYSINVSELEQLDELLSWCLENDLHLMISIMGMPGKANTSIEEEEVGKNDQIFTDPAMTEAYQKYMEMLAIRYADIPSKALSFELLAEATAPDMDTYEAVLASVAEAMWEYDSSKILVANDLMKMVPERLAEIGCCLSLHNHFYSINGANLTDWYGVDMSVTYWPMASVVEAQTDGQTTKLYSEEGFVETTLSLSYTYFNFEPVLYADGVQISWENATGRHLVYDVGELHAKIPDGTKELTIVVKEEMGVSVIAVAQGKQMAYILPIGASGIYLDAFAIEYEFTITSDGKVLAANEATEQMQSWQFMYDHSISKFVECAEKNGVSFIMTEIGTDTQSLSVEDYIAYHTEWLEVLKEHGIGWMYNCIHNILAPPDIMWQGQSQGFTVTPIEGTPYFENREITDMLAKYAQ